MRLRRLEVDRFRGVRHLDWRHINGTAVLIGAANSCKTTILDAVERVLSPKWTVAFEDTDFWGLSFEQPIVVRCTVTHLPRAFYRETKFGLRLQKLDPVTGVASPHLSDGEDPRDDALVLELRVDATLEPVWNVIDGQGREHPISARDRAELGLIRVGATVDSHLSWNRSSVLSRLTDDDDAAKAALSRAVRQARGRPPDEELAPLQSAASRIGEMATVLGVPSRGLTARLDVMTPSTAGVGLSLYDGELPIRRAGLSTRRLLAAAMVRGAAGGAAVTLIDEVEHGLEPHRLRRLLRLLRGTPPEVAVPPDGQLILTTQSPTVLSELRASDVCVVRRDSDGNVVIASLPQELAPALSRSPEAFLSPKLIVAGGELEHGLCRALDRAWAVESHGASFAYRGVGVVSCVGGVLASAAARDLQSLGYHVELLAGWAPVEERLAQDLPLEGVREMAALAARSPRAVENRPVRDCLSDEIHLVRGVLDDSARTSVEAVGEAAFRGALGAASSREGWFRTRALGFALGQLVVRHWAALVGTATRERLEQLRKFVHHG